MMAMLLVALSVGLSLNAAQQARDASRLTQELRSANTLLEALMDDGARSFSPSSGESRGFAWTLETQITDGARPIELCRRHVELRSLTSRRRYVATSVETCPASDPS